LELLAQVREAIVRHGLLVPGQTVVVGVSGGPDSLCLLDLLRRLAPDFSLSLHVAHLNHKMRGQDADADAAFVAKLAADWHVPATIEVVDVPALAQAHKMAPEEAARRARYTFLTQVAERLGAPTVAVAHNADDQAETVLMHFLRGSGLAGLRGMLPATPMEELRLEIGEWRVESKGEEKPQSSHLKSITLVRPLLEVPRAEIEAYCDAYNLQPRFDRSNLDTTYFRNRLRHELLPYLETYNSNIRTILRRTAAVAAADYELLRDEVDATWGQIVRFETEQAVTFDLDAWHALPLALRRSTIREAIHRLRRALRNIDFVHVENAIEILAAGETGSQATLPQGLMLTIGYDVFTIADEGSHELPDLPWLLTEEALDVTVPGYTRLPQSRWGLRADVLPGSALSAEDLTGVGGWEAYLDATVVGIDPSLRRRRPGDHFYPLGMRGRGKRLNEFMINEKIPAFWRAYIPLLVSGEDEILWVCGWRPDERAALSDSSQRLVHFRFERE
jgi:tRNA(Ile)-lysidine synthetase-like protein